MLRHHDCGDPNESAQRLLARSHPPRQKHTPAACFSNDRGISDPGAPTRRADSFHSVGRFFVRARADDCGHGATVRGARCCGRCPRPAQYAQDPSSAFAVPRFERGRHVPTGSASGWADASEARAPLAPVADSASTSAKVPDGQCPSPGSTPSAIFLAGAFSSTVPVLQRHEPLHACAASWRLILQGVTYVLGHHNEWLVARKKRWLVMSDEWQEKSRSLTRCRGFGMTGSTEFEV